MEKVKRAFTIFAARVKKRPADQYRMMWAGLKGYAMDVFFPALPLVLFCLLAAVVIFGIYSFLTVGLYYAGIESGDAFGFPDWVFYLAHGVVIGVVGALTLIYLLRLPRALRKRGEALEAARKKEKLISEAQERLAARGGYTDPARNHRKGARP